MASIRQVAEECGVSKPHVSKIIRELDPEGLHQEMRGNRRELDEWLSSAVASEVLRRRQEHRAPEEDCPGGVGGPQPPAARDEDMRDETLALVRELYEGRVADLRGQIDELRAQVRDLQALASGYQQEVSDLQRAAVDHAKELPAARDEARRAGAEQERERIRSLGALARLFGNF